MKFLYYLFIPLAFLIMCSCAKDEDTQSLSLPESRSTIEKNVATYNYDLSLIRHRDFLRDIHTIGAANLERLDSRNSIMSLPIASKDSIYKYAVEYVRDLGLTTEDFDEIFEPNARSNNYNLQDAVIGVYVMGSIVDICMGGFNFNDITPLHPAFPFIPPMDYDQNLLDCLLDVMGINEAITLLDQLSAGLVNRSTLKSVLKQICKTTLNMSTRTAYGIGLVILAAEVAWCLWGNS